MGAALGFGGEPFGRVAKRANEVVEALADRGGVVEATDDRLGLADDLVAELGDPTLAFGDELVGAAAR